MPLRFMLRKSAPTRSNRVPFSTWSIVFASLIVANGIAPEGEGLDPYISAIPYMLYAWVAVLLVPVVIAGFIPALGSMNNAEARAQSTGQTVPPGAEHIDKANQSIQPKDGVKPQIFMFIVPMTLLIAATL